MFVNCIKRCANGAVYKSCLRTSVWGPKKQHSEISSTKWPLLDKYSNKRCFSVLAPHPTPGSTTLVTQEDVREFMSMYPELVNDLTMTACNEDVTDDCAKFYKELLIYNMPNRIHGLGHVTAPAYEILISPEDPSPEYIRLANTLGWCVELLQLKFNIEDDVMEQADTRFNQLCWYKKPNIGLTAMNDAKLVEQGLYTILRKYFNNHHCYVSMVDLFHFANIKTTFGQLLDAKYTMKDGKFSPELFTTSRYSTLAKHKTGYMNVLSVRLAMYLANIVDIKAHEAASSVLLQLGELNQIDNDVLDCFGDVKDKGKVGTDIRNGQCTWLIAQALERASPAQKKILEENYGRAKPECEKSVIRVYEELDLFNMYLTHKKQTFDTIRGSIQNIANKQLQMLFHKWCENPVIGIETLAME